MLILETLKNEILPLVHKPGQYLGNEFGAVNKDWDSAKSRMALIYPDLYELGMSNFGLKILYNIVNKHPDYLCDRAFAPMQDMEKLLRERQIPLWGWESYKPLKEFNMLGFSLGYELCYTNFLTILDLAQIPLYAKDRTLDHPLIFAGGPATHNPEIMADFFDFYLIGDGEDLIIEIQDSYLKTLDKLSTSRDGSRPVSTGRNQILFNLAQIQGVYVPQFYTPDPNENMFPKPNLAGLPLRVKKRIAQLTDLNQPISGPVPHMETVQDKQVMEIRRGCDRGCRFCQVGYTYLPVRERSPEDLLRLSSEALHNTGYDNYTMLSLSASDYTCLTEAARAMNNKHADSGISLSMPSQRADRFNVELASEVQQVRKSGLTFAPEAGTEKLRRIINKGLKEDDIKNAIRFSYMEGWSHIKLYFMIGLPYEEDEDLDGILDILTWSINMSRQLKREARAEGKILYTKPLNITCTISTFVPKSFTAFQWFPQCSGEEFKRKQDYLKTGLRERGIHRFIKLNCTDPSTALLEAVLSRGDRRWGEVVKEVWRMGARMDSWSENFNIEIWNMAAAKYGLSLSEEASKHRIVGAKQPWDVLDIGFTDEFLVKEWNQAVEAAETQPCTENKCHACGVCFQLGVKNVVTYDRSKFNPFVTEIDKEKRQESCANFIDYLKKDKKEDQKELGGPKLVVKNTTVAQKIRLVLTKLEDLRFISHLDFQRLIEKALRRSGLPVVHTTGYNQRMKLTWGGALPLFIESEWEYLEIGLAEIFEDLENLKEILNNQLPKQARIKKVEVVLPDDKTSINRIVEVEYRAKLGESLSLKQELVDSFLSQDVIEVVKLERDGKKIKNLKGCILEMRKIDSEFMKLKLNSLQRPDEVLNNFVPGNWRITKTYQKIT